MTQERDQEAFESPATSTFRRFSTEALDAADLPNNTFLVLRQADVTSEELERLCENLNGLPENPERLSEGSEGLAENLDGLSENLEWTPVGLEESREVAEVVPEPLMGSSLNIEEDMEEDGDTAPLAPRHLTLQGSPEGVRGLADPGINVFQNGERNMERNRNTRPSLPLVIAIRHRQLRQIAEDEGNEGADDVEEYIVTISEVHCSELPPARRRGAASSRRRSQRAPVNASAWDLQNIFGVNGESRSRRSAGVPYEPFDNFSSEAESNDSEGEEAGQAEGRRAFQDSLRSISTTVSVAISPVSSQGDYEPAELDAEAYWGFPYLNPEAEEGDIMPEDVYSPDTPETSEGTESSDLSEEAEEV